MSSETSQVEYIRKVALIGGSGQIGSHFLKHLLANGKHSITVLTRHDSTATFPSSPSNKLTVTKVDYSNEESLVQALSGHDILIISLSARAPPTLHPSIVAAAAKAGIPYVMPNYYGYGLGTRAIKRERLADFTRYIKDVEGTEGVDYVALVCGFWYEFSVAMGEPWLGFRIRNRTVTMYDDGNKKINMSTWERCGEAVASLLSLPVKSSDGENGKLSLDTYKNSGVYISSFLVSQRDILNSLHRVLGTTDADWSITYEPVDKRLKEGKEEYQQGNFLGFAKALYAGVFTSENADYETGNALDNGRLGLGEEEFDGATRRAVEMAEGTMGDFGF